MLFGKAIPHESARLHVTGEAVYLDDMPPLHNELLLDFVGSPVAHGLLRAIDVAEARTAPGIAAIFTSADVPGDNHFGPVLHDEELLVRAECQHIGQPIVLLAGGRDKHLPMEDWAALIRERAHHLVVFGEAATLIASAARQAGLSDDAIVVVESLDQAVGAAVEVSHPGDAVLLSPGCTSYDAFFDFEARGDRFRELVTRISQERS